MASDSQRALTSCDVEGPGDAEEAAALNRLLECILLRCGHDFRHYTRQSLQRRLARALQQLGSVSLNSASLDALRAAIAVDPALLERLLPYLTVPVSAMFRDPVYYRAFREQVVPWLRTCSAPKLWVAGCCAGEEAFSLAIVLAEEGLLDRCVIYATDINPQTLARARRGILPLEQLQAYTGNYQRAGGRRAFSDYYLVDYDNALLDRGVRERIVFAGHSLITDGAFSEVQFISCRNVMIYFDRQLQNRVLSLFAGALSAEGMLGVGARESVDVRRGSRFENFVRNARIYRRRRESFT